MSMGVQDSDKRPIIVIKKKVAGHGHHGGAWKVAYADFVTAMMALFIVLWLLSTADPKTKKDLARYFRDPGFLQGGSAAIVPGDEGGAEGRPTVMTTRPDGKFYGKSAHDKEDSLLRAVQHALKADLDRAASESSEMADLRKQVVVTVSPEGLEIQFIDRDGDHDLLFDLSSAELKPALVKLLRRMSDDLAKIDNALVIGGHTDARAFARGSNKNNWDLSYERADAARKVLESGVLKGRVHRVAAYGSSEPFDRGNPNSASNRRLSIIALRHARVVSTAPPSAPDPQAPAALTAAPAPTHHGAP